MPVWVQVNELLRIDYLTEEKNYRRQYGDIKIHLR